MPDLMIERIVPWQLNGQKQSAFLCTPEHLDELAAGYLYTQGMIAGLGDIAEIAGDENGLNVTLREGVAPRRTDILERLQACPACKSDFQAPLVQIQAMCRQLLSEKNYFGTHRLALHCGDQVAYREDVGRHNAADKCIAYGLQRFSPCRPGRMIVGGGGCYNLTLMAHLRDLLSDCRVMTNEDLGLDGNAKEAVAFALLANETIFASCNNAPGATGARHPVVMGKISL